MVPVKTSRVIFRRKFSSARLRGICPHEKAQSNPSNQHLIHATSSDVSMDPFASTVRNSHPISRRTPLHLSTRRSGQSLIIALLLRAVFYRALSSPDRSPPHPTRVFCSRAQRSAGGKRMPRSPIKNASTLSTWCSYRTPRNRMHPLTAISDSISWVPRSVLMPRIKTLRGPRSLHTSVLPIC